jgi:NAD(P)-dependent dehydrogenase (short-subunit alcohol dehydrogenase family)
MKNLANKVAVITGAAQGIGYAIAARFVADGMKVVLADIQDDKGAEAARTLGAGTIYAHCDVGDRSQVEALVATAVEQFGSLDVMVSNAAVLHPADVLDLEEEDFDRVVRVNLKGAFLTSQAAARHMVTQASGGSIINMSSIQAIITNPNLLSYAVCKGGIRQLTVAMSLALARKGVRVNAIAPGSISTDMVRQLMVNDDARRQMLSRTPMGRMGEPEEIAAIAAFLASDESSYITGETIAADGGRLGQNYTAPVDD